MKNNKLKLIIIPLLAFMLLIPLSYSYAALPSIFDRGGSGEQYSAGCVETGDCQLNDFMVIVARGAQIIMGITGSLVLLAFIFGGFTLMTSAGNNQSVEKGKNIIVGAVIGMIIVFTSYIIIGYVFDTFGLSWGWDTTGGFR
ncbi:MAG: hypothetical protein ABH881_02675 [bacterium]